MSEHIEGESLQVGRVTPVHFKQLAVFFDLIKREKEDAFFHPHPFDRENAEKIANYSGKDLYCIASFANEVLAYGMLRGWDEGFEKPSLGIIVSSARRKLGLGHFFMSYLHLAAKLKGAGKVRLKVYPDNTPALALYRSIGYSFLGEENGQLVGEIEL